MFLCANCNTSLDVYSTLHCLRADIKPPPFFPAYSSILNQSEMRRWKMIITSEAALWLAVLFLFLEKVPGRKSHPRVYNDTPKSRRTWCEETNACARCEKTNPPRCSGRVQPVLGADLCECCFSCVAARDLGESCGSQLSIWPEILGSDPSSSSVTILATTWCREGLVCVNFACLDSGSDAKPGSSQRLKTNQESTDEHESDVSRQDMISIDAELDQGTTTSSWERILDDRNDPDFQQTVSSIRIAPTESSAPLLAELGQKPQPCFAKSEETVTISSYPSDDMLGRISTTSLAKKGFQLVYAGDLMSDLKVLLNVVDTCHGDSLLNEGAVDSLVEGLPCSLSPYDDVDYDGLPLSYEDYVEVLTPSQKTETSPNPYNLTSPARPREKRDLEMMEDDDAEGFDAPGNIQEILIRGASAHKEYFHGGRGHEQGASTPNKSVSDMPVERSSQEDESTVRVHITNRPRKVQTLIDLEEDDEGEEKIGEEERRGLQLADRGRAKGAGRLSPLAEEQNGVSPGVPRPLGGKVTTEQNAATEKTARSGSTDVPQSVNLPRNETPTTINDRLTLLEFRINVFERVLEEIAKWCNLGVFSMTRDCLLAQNSDIRYGRRGSETDEHLGVASGIDVVRSRGNERRLNGNVPRRDGFHDTKIPDAAKLDGIISPRQMAHRERTEPINRNFFRTITDNGSRRRFPNSRHHEPRRRVESPCRNRSNREKSWRQQISEATSRSPAHRNVQRSIVSPMSPFSRNFSGAGRTKIVDETASRDLIGTLPFGALLETQIPLPTTFAKKVLTLGDLEKQELSPHADVFPQEWDSTGEITESSRIPSSKMFARDENERENEEQRSSFPVLTKRSVKQVDGILPRYEKLGKIRPGFSVPARGDDELFEKEIAARKELESKMWGKVRIGINGRGRRVAGPLIANGNQDFRNPPEPIANRLLFRNSNFPQTTESAAAVIPRIFEDDRKLLDPRPVIYTLTSPVNWTVPIEEISEDEYEDGLPQILDSSTAEDDFDHIYEGVEAEDDDGEFEYDVAYDQVEYVDGSSVEIVTKVPVNGFGKPETGSKFDHKLPRNRVHSALFPREKTRRVSRTDDQCESARIRAKREIPLPLFGSTGEHEPKTIVWPSNWIGYRRDGLQAVGGAEGSGNQGNTPNSGSWGTATLRDATIPKRNPPTRRTTERRGS